jgi:hypothetical protein
MIDDRLMMQERLLYQFRLEDHVPADHLSRAIDCFIDLDGLRRHLAPFYSTTGHPFCAPDRCGLYSGRGAALSANAMVVGVREGLSGTLTEFFRLSEPITNSLK